MPTPEALFAFVVAAVLLIVVPGPSVLFVIGRALAYGRRVAIGTVAGSAAGAAVLAVAVAVGLGALIQASATAFTAMKLIGAAYLIYLGVRALRHRRSLREAFTQPDTAPPLSGRRSLVEGFLVGVSNPKTAVFFVAVLPHFIDRSAGHPTLQMLLLAAIFTAIAFVSDSGWGVVASGARSWFVRSPRRLEFAAGGAGLTMIGLGVSVAATGHRS
ncbi:LysE family translocator [Natronosporangium hydrolyticum]|uniref:LysE family translocator n=1 Tax=Natronosporangium hydrolyticum TaxID=2811111 RepID=A0A895YLV7_9ACTN|nr:LysE family translocator [Natronosporangium hydrolyticum]QSB14868.1 LysE family translocator [Natronosporangium hydrolyticum]